MIKTIIIDDEPLAAEIVREFLAEFPQFKVLEVCQDGFQGLKAIQHHQPDLIFLDVCRRQFCKRLHNSDLKNTKPGPKKER